MKQTNMHSLTDTELIHIQTLLARLEEKYNNTTTSLTPETWLDNITFVEDITKDRSLETRIHIALKRNGINTVEELLYNYIKNGDSIKIHHIGPKAKPFIESFIKSYQQSVSPTYSQLMDKKIDLENDIESLINVIIKLKSSPSPSIDIPSSEDLVTQFKKMTSIKDKQKLLNILNTNNDTSISSLLNRADKLKTLLESGRDELCECFKQSLCGGISNENGDFYEH